MWGVKTETVPVIVGALEAMPHSIKRNLKKIFNNSKEETIHTHSSIIALLIFEYLFLRNRVEAWNK